MAWGVPKIGTVAEVASGNLTLTEPAGVVQGDLLIACIAIRSTVGFANSDWIKIEGQLSGNTVSTGAGIASGEMWYCVRGSSAPSLVFTRTGGDLGRGVILAYSGGKKNATAVLSVHSSNTLASASATATTGTITTVEANELIVAMIAQGDNYTASAFDAATDPTTASGATDTTTAPTAGTWIERTDSGTNTGADGGLAVADAIRATAGATGTIQCTSSGSARHVMIAAAFRLLVDTTVSTGVGALAATGVAPTVMGGGPVVPVAHASASSTSASSGATTSAIDTTGANLITIVVSYDSGGTGLTVSDSKSNTWVARTAVGSFPVGRIYDCFEPIVGSGHTFSVAGTNVYAGIAAIAFCRVAGSPFDTENGAFQIGATTVQPGSVTPSQAGELLVSGLGWNQAGSPISINSGFTELEERDFASLQSYGIDIAYLVQAAAAAINPTWTRGTGTSGLAATIATYKAAPGSGTANPGVGAVTATGFAPTVTVTSNLVVAVGVGALSGTGFAPSVVIGTVAYPPVGQATATGFAPTVTIGTVAYADVGAASISGFAPTVTATDNQTASPGVGGLVATGFAPTVLLDVFARPDVGALAASGFAPTVTASDHQTVTPGVGAVAADGFPPSVIVGTVAYPSTGDAAATGFAPSVVLGTVAYPGTGTVTTTAFAPTVTASDNQTAAPQTGALVADGFAPTVRLDVFAPTETGVLSATGFAPTVIIPGSVEPGTGQVIATGLAPTVVVTDNVTAATDTGSLIATGIAPSVLTPVVVTPDVGALAVTGFAPSVQVTAGVTVLPGTGQVDAAGFAPTVTASNHVVVTPGTGVISLVGHAPIVLTPVTVNPDTGALTVDGFAPDASATANVFVLTDTGLLIATGFAPSVVSTGEFVVRLVGPLHRMGTETVTLVNLRPAVALTRARPPVNVTRMRPAITLTVEGSSDG